MSSRRIAMSKSDLTRERLLDHALSEAVRGGPDRLGFTAVAKLAGMSTGALYSRYENADELLVDLWERRALPALQDLTELIIGSTLDVSREPSRKSIVARLNRGDETWTLVALLMTVARRNDVLREVVEPDVRRVVDAARARLATHPQILASILGVLLTVRGARIQGFEWSYFVSVICSAAEEASKEIVEVGREYPRFETLTLDGLDDFDSRLFLAAAEVIGRVGVDQATISRMARSAGVNPAGIYARHHDKEHLLGELIAAILVSVAEADNKMQSEFLANKPIYHLMIDSQRATVDPIYRPVRNLRLELIYAAGHHEEIRVAMIGKYRILDAKDLMGPRFPTTNDNPSIRPFRVMGRALMYGNTLMLEYGYLGPDEQYVGSMAKHLVKELTDLYLLSAKLTPAE